MVEFAQKRMIVHPQKESSELDQKELTVLHQRENPVLAQMMGSDQKRMTVAGWAVLRKVIVSAQTLVMVLTDHI